MKALKFIGQSAMFLVIMSTILLAWFMWSSEATTAKADLNPEEQKKSEARYACKEAIKASLHNPDTADWGARSGNWHATWPAAVDGDVVTVLPEFRASNAMGGTVLTSWNCKIRITDENWTFLALDEL